MVPVDFKKVQGPQNPELMSTCNFKGNKDSIMEPAEDKYFQTD